MAAAHASFLPSLRCFDTGSGFYGNERSGGSKKKGLWVLTWGEVKMNLGIWRAALPYGKGARSRHRRDGPSKSSTRDIRVS